MLEHTMVEGASNLFRLEPGSVAPPFVAALRSGALLARVDAAVYRLAGPRALAIAATAGLDVPPAPGRVLEGPGVQIARGGDAAPFVVQLTAPPPEAAALAVRLVAAGAVEADPVALELARILAGWPRLGAEVDEKTIPQEVRYDEIGGVSYTKGCYTGQDARVVDLPFVLPAVGPA